MKRVIIAVFIMVLLAALLFADGGGGGKEVVPSETPVLDSVLEAGVLSMVGGSAGGTFQTSGNSVT